jgi:hypothetical protein
LIGLINRMRLFAPPDVVSAAEAVLRAIAEIALRPSVELRQLAKEAVCKGLDPDPLLAFSEICRADLDTVRGERPLRMPLFRIGALLAAGERARRMPVGRPSQ